MEMWANLGKALLVVSFLVMNVPDFANAETKVNCTKGQSVQAALDRLPGPGTIVVTGTCIENIVINKDDVTLQGGIYMPLDSTQNTIWVQGARRVLIKGVTVTGGRNGIAAYQGASLTVEGNSTISGASNNGVVASFGSTATVNSSTAQGNLQGVTATDNSAVVLINSTIKDNTGTGVLVVRSSSARIGQNTQGTVGANSITGNSGSGVSISRGSFGLIDHSTITGNGGDGINVEGSFATITNNVVSGSRKGISVHNGGSARIGITDGDQPGPNTVENNSLEGIQSANGRAVYIYANTIQNNGVSTGRPGVGIYRATGRLLGGNSIKENGGNGLEVDQGALFQGVGDFNLSPVEDTITNNTYSGISVWNGASADIRKILVTANHQNGLYVGVRSSMRIYDSAVSGHLSPYSGVYVNRGAALILDHPSGIPPITVTNNTGWGVLCGDLESSLAGDINGVTGNTAGNVSCTGF